MAAKADDQDARTEVVEVEEGRDAEKADPSAVPRPTPQFRRRAWVAFQRALDPLSSPRPLPPPRA
jgi:hypothetical protein